MTDNNTEKEILAGTNDKVANGKDIIDEPKKPSRLLIIIVIISFLLSLICLVLGFYFYKSTSSVNNIYLKKIDSLSSQLVSQVDQQNQQFKQSQSSFDKLQTEVEQLTIQLVDEQNKSKVFSADVETLQRKFAETNSRDSSDWILSEVEYLINLSGRKLWLENDLTSSLSLLNAADKRIIDMGDPSLNPLRRALLDDINKLEALPSRDVDKVVLSLSSLDRRVDQLVVAGLKMPEVAEEEGKGVSTNIADWEQNLNKSVNTFMDSFVVVTKRNKPVEALISPEQAWYLKENLRSHLSKAEFAVYREQQQIYDLALQSAMSLVEVYYDLEDKNNQQFYKRLTQLSEEKVVVDYPDQFESASLLSRILKQRISKTFTIESTE